MCVRVFIFMCVWVCVCVGVCMYARECCVFACTVYAGIHVNGGFHNIIRPTDTKIMLITILQAELVVNPLQITYRTESLAKEKNVNFNVPGFFLLQ